MAACKDCLHYDICVFHIKGNENERCKQFLNTADVVEVVRCKDCKYWRGVTFGYACRKLSGLNTKYNTKPTDFCSLGERKEQE